MVIHPDGVYTQYFVYYPGWDIKRNSADMKELCAIRMPDFLVFKEK
jgi:hypothetical protein